MEAKTQARIEKFFAQTNKTEYTLKTTDLNGFNLIPPRQSFKAINYDAARTEAINLAETVAEPIIEEVGQEDGSWKTQLTFISYKTGEMVYIY